MASPGGIDGKDFCNDIKNINGIALASIKKFLGKTKDCLNCQAVSLSTDRSPAIACNLSCSTYYTDGDPTNLQLGDRVFTNSTCTSPVSKNYYSDKCGGRTGSVYLINNGAITNVASC